MPIIRMTLIEGATAEQKHAMYREVTDAVQRALGAPRENVRIMLNEIPASHFACGGVPWAAEPANAAPARCSE